jgi:ABC-type amino acid transport substrate-binding protein
VGGLRPEICQNAGGADPVLPIKALVAVLGLSLIALGPPALAQTDSRLLRVVVKSLVPFVLIRYGTYAGFSIDLWKAIAPDLGRPYQFVHVDTVQEQLATVERGEAGVAIAGISITSDRALQCEVGRDGGRRASISRIRTSTRGCRP